MIDILPPEIVLNVLEYCSIQEICTIQLVSRTWDEIIKENEATVYHAAAIYHGFIKPHRSVDDARSNYPGCWLDKLRGWKDLCQRWFQTEKNWEGHGETPTELLLKSSGDDVHRFKLDESQDARFVITTHRKGGLRVICMDTDVILFELGKSYVRHYAHCEYGNGFLVFDRFHPHALEIWRHESLDWDGSHLTSCFRPDEMQFSAPIRMVDASAAYPRRGRFAPWALFAPAHNPRAYRFVYPTLLVGSEEGQELYLFDVPSATLVQTIPIPRVGMPPAAFNAVGGVRILYVELGARHVFVCTMHGVLILPRSQANAPGSRNVTMLDFPNADPGLRVPDLVRHYAARMVQTIGPPSNAAMREYMVTAAHVPEQSTAVIRLGDSQQVFSAIHVSSSGKDFVAITELGIAYLVPDFERVFRGEKTFSEIALRIDMGAPATNLAFDYDRVVIQTILGVYILSLHTSPHAIVSPRAHVGHATPEPNAFPGLTVHQLLHFRNPLPLRLVSCVKLTKTGVWLDWSARALEEVEGRRAPIDEEDELVEFGDMIEEEHPYATRMVCWINFSPQKLRGAD